MTGTRPDPIDKARASNERWRPVGLGVMGLQDVFFQLRLPFAAEASRALSERIAEAIYFHAPSASVGLSRHKDKHVAFEETRAARGELQCDAWGVTPIELAHWDELTCATCTAR